MVRFTNRVPAVLGSGFGPRKVLPRRRFAPACPRIPGCGSNSLDRFGGRSRIARIRSRGRSRWSSWLAPFPSSNLFAVPSLDAATCRYKDGSPMLPERLEPFHRTAADSILQASRMYVRNSVVWCPTSAHPNGARTGTGWDRTGWSWDGHRAPARRPCAPREPPDTAPTCAYRQPPAMHRSSFHPIRGRRSPGCSGRPDKRRSSRGPTRQVSEPAGSQTRRPARIQNISSAKLWFELGNDTPLFCRVDRRQHPEAR